MIALGDWENWIKLPYNGGPLTGLLFIRFMLKAAMEYLFFWPLDVNAYEF